MPVISTNTAANTAVRYLNSNSQDQTNSLAKLASGSRINKASDDAAGLAISTKIGTDVAALEQASTNASHAVSVLSTADGGASNIADIVERMKTLASESASGTVTDTERAYVQAEFEELQEEIDGICESTRYNGQSLLDGSSDFAVDDVETAAVVEGASATYTAASAVDTTGTITINDIEVTLTATSDGTNATMTVDEMVDQINSALNDEGEYTIVASNESGTLTLTSLAKGDNAEITLEDGSGTLNLASLGLTAGTTNGTTTEVDTTGADIVVGSTSADTINLSIDSLTCDSLGIADLDVSTEEGAAEALSVLDLAIDQISEARAEIGATMSRFEFRSAQIDTSVENLESAQSAIADVDIAAEQASLSSSSVKVQAAVAAASQANQMPQNLLSLIQ
ncbi:flagellin [uncultured Cohaesibacter sp.]|uniref:flagellin N-terminal helical domain-containing protein n=1 Tax=uncultured Cohaesibacter sp. TaxID=1002546 RepID=UPI0029C99A9F|nr:flagellin [uncultured Cohaesibacter sp.]